MVRKYLLKKSFARQIKNWLIWSLAVTFSFLLLGIMTATAIFIALSQDLPSAAELKNINFTQSTTIYDRTGKVLYTIHGEENRKVVPFQEISPHLIQATLAMEDQNFYRHRGVYVKRILGAVYLKIIGALTGSNRRLAGASTITQQFAKNAFLTPERTMERKIKELILAIRLERYYTKDEILELYLNKIPYGNNAYGIERAAEIYFNKHAADLSLAESAILAAIPQAPSKYNPYGQYGYSAVTKEFTPDELDDREIKNEENLNSNEFQRGLIGKVTQLDPEHKVYVRGRTDLVLRLMLEQGFISTDQKQKAWEETQKIQFYKSKERINAPHFVFYVKQLLEERYGKDMVEHGGLKVYTTLDYEIQQIAEKTVKERGEYNEKQYGASNAALLALHAPTGQILAMVGSRDYDKDEIDGKVNIVLRKRQPGSSFKPIVYAQAFSKKYSPANVVYDLETKFDGGEPPKNFDGRFEGPITIRHALAQSRNIPAIKMYFLGGGQKEIIPFAQKLGIHSLDPNFSYEWPLGLGAGELTMLELAGAYNVFANTGIKHPISPILKIESNNGEILEQWQMQSEEVLNPQVAFLINSILSDREHWIGKKLEISGYENAAKTGTTNKPYSKKGEKNPKVLPNNAWTFNYTTKLVTAVWVGNNDGSPMKWNANGYDSASPIAKEFMTQVFEKRREEFQPENFEIPKGIERITVSAASGKLPGPLNPPDMLRTDYFASFAKPTEIDTSFEEASIDLTTNEIATAYCPPEQIVKKVFRKHQDIDTSYTRWQDAVLAWAYSNPEWSNQLPKNTCRLHNETTFQDMPTVKIISPLPNDFVKRGILQVVVNTPAKHGVDRVEFFLNDNLQYTAKDSPFTGSVRIPRNARAGQQFRLRVSVYDTLQYKSSTEIALEVADLTEETATEILNEDENIIEEELSGIENNLDTSTSSTLPLESNKL